MKITLEISAKEEIPDEMKLYQAAPAIEAIERFTRQRLELKATDIVEVVLVA